MINTTSPVKTRIIDKKSPMQAEFNFDLGNACYNQGHFAKSISYLFKAIKNFTSSKRIADAYMLIGANYFYLDEVDYAKKYFKKSKRSYSKCYPSKKDFPNEIRKLFYSAK